MKKIGGLFLVVFALGLGLSSARGATWYLQANEGEASTDWNTLSFWFSQPIGGGTHPVSISSADNFDMNGYSLITPKLTSGTGTFGGNALIFHGGLGSYLSTKTTPPAGVAIGNLYSYGGVVSMNASTGNLAMSIGTLENFSNTTFSGGNNTRGLNIAINTLSGGGDISAVGNGGGSAGGAVLLGATTATAFTGTLYICNGCQFTFENALVSGGALDVEGAGTAVTLNFAVTFKGLTVNGVIEAPGTYSAASLGFTGTGSVNVQAAMVPTIPVTQMFGTNLPGGSFSGTPFYPTDALVWNYLQTKNLNLVRVAFKWEQIEPTLNGPLNTSALASLDTAVSLAAARGMQVILDMHNYDTYNVSGTSYLIGSTQVPYSAYQYAWQLIAAHFAGDAGIYGYDIMNEPNGDSGTWDSTAAQDGVNGVRQSDSTHYVIVEGDSYAGAQSWMSVNANLNVTDSANLLIYSAHTYWDSNDSGTYAGSYDSNNDYPDIGVDRVAQFIYWLQLKGARGFVGEFGVPNNVSSPDYRWNVALNSFMSYLNVNGVNATYWSMTQNGWPNTYTLLCATGGKAPGPVVAAPAMNVLENYGLAGVVPAISAQPVAQVVTAGQSVTLSVAASGTGALSYQWSFNGAIIAGATGSTYSIANVEAANAGNYSVMITDAFGYVTSRAVGVSVNPAPVGTDTPTMPEWMLVLLGGALFCSAVLTGRRPGLMN